MNKTDKTPIPFNWKKWFELDKDIPPVAKFFHFNLTDERNYDWYNWRPYLRSIADGAKLMSDLTDYVTTSATRPRSYLGALRYWLDSEQYNYMFANELNYLTNFADIAKLEHADELVDRTHNYINHSGHNHFVRFMYIMLMARDFLELSPDNIVDYLRTHPALCYGDGAFDNELVDQYKKILQYCKTDAAKKLFDFITNNSWISVHKAKEIGL